MAGKTVLNIVEEATHFSGVTLLHDVFTVTIWKKILFCWAFIYIGPLNRMLVDRESAFAPLFRNNVAVSMVDVDGTGIEAHSSLGLGERYHQPLHQTYRKIMAKHTNVDPQYALAAAVKAMNDTLVPEGLGPSALVFGEFLQF